MTQLPALAEDLEDYGPMMQALTVRQRAFVLSYLNEPMKPSRHHLLRAGFSDGCGTAYASKMMHDDRVLAAIHEQSQRQLSAIQLTAVAAVAALALNPGHKDHLKACLAIMDRTGHHAKSEHAVTIDDRRPQTRQELVQAVIQVAKEAGLDNDAIKKLTGGDVVDADFTEVEDVDAQIAQEMAEL